MAVVQSSAPRYQVVVPQVKPRVAIKANPFLSAGTFAGADVACILLAVAISILLWRIEQPGVAMRNFFLLGPTLCMYLGVFAWSGLYTRAAINPVEELQKLVKGSTLVCLTLTTVTFF